MSQNDLGALISAYQSNVAQQRRMVLATVVKTWGSTYRKSGARMLIHDDGSVTGILGGGCFDSDLAQHAKQVLDSGKAQTVMYDMRSPDEAIWGLGLGCNGAVEVLLQIVGADINGDPVPLIGQLFEGTGGHVATALSDSGPHQIGYSWIDEASGAGCEHSFIQQIQPPFHLGIFGAGADVLPLTQLAASLGWRVSICDYRPAYAVAERFPEAAQICVFDSELPDSLANCQAMIVMSHSLDADRKFLSCLADSGIQFIGVLGPTQRRERLLEELGSQADRIKHRLRGPVGLDLGGELPEEIALEIISEIQAYRFQRHAANLTALEST